MASETVVPDHSIDEKVEDKLNEEIKAIEKKDVSPLKESEGTDKEEHANIKELATSEALVIDAEEKTEDKQIEMPTVTEVEKSKKVDESPSLDAPVEDNPKIVEELDPKFEVSSASEPIIEACEKELNEELEVPYVPKSSVESIEKEKDNSKLSSIQEPESEVVKELEEVSESESKVEEKTDSEVPDVSITSIEGIKKSEEHSETTPTQSIEKAEKNLEVPPIEEPECEVVKELEKVSESVSEVEKIESEVPNVLITSVQGIEKLEEHSEAPSKEPESEAGKETEELSELVAEKVGKIESVEEEQSEITEEIEKKTVEIDSKDIVEGEIKKDEETSLEKCEEGIESLKEEDPKENEGGSILPDVVEKAIDDIKKEETEVKEEEKNVKVEDEKEEEKNVKAEEIESMRDSYSVKEVVEEPLKGEKASREVDMVSEDKKEEMGEDNIGYTSNEPVKEHKELNLEEKDEETSQKDIDKLEKKEEVCEEISRSDDPKLEPSNDSEDLKPDADLPKQKQSNNFISKVKQSIVKVKKAITGKSPSSKTVSSETKDDIKVK